MSDNRPTLHLVDGSGYIFRAFYAIRPLSTRTGVPTNAVLGFARMLIKLINEEKPHLLGVAFDTREKNFRHALHAEYKANRDAPPEDLGPQFPLIHELVLAMDIPLLMQAGFEADDVLATLAKKGVAAGYDVTVVTGDKDLMQLVSPGIQLFDPMKDKRFGREEVIERFGVPPELVADVLALAGDSSDNIPGVPKVGEKSAAKLVSELGDVEAIIKGLSAPGRKLKAYELSVLENAESARLSKRLATLCDTVPIALEPEKLLYGAPKPEKLGPFLRKVEAVSLLRDLHLEVVSSPTASVAEAGEAPGYGPASDRGGPGHPGGPGDRNTALQRSAATPWLESTLLSDEAIARAAGGRTTVGSAAERASTARTPETTVIAVAPAVPGAAGATTDGGTIGGATTGGATTGGGENAGTAGGATDAGATSASATSEATAGKSGTTGAATTAVTGATDSLTSAARADAGPEQSLGAGATDGGAVTGVGSASVPSASADPALTPVDRSRYRTLFACAEIAAYLERARAVGEIAVDLETTSLDANRCEIVGIALCVPGEPAVYVPVAHRYLGVPKQVACKEALALLAPVLADPHIRKVGQNIKYDMVALARAGLELAGLGDDSMIAAYVLDPARASFGLDALARQFLAHENIRYQDVTGSGKRQMSFEEVTVEAATQYAAEDADVALRLCHILRRKVNEAGLTALYREIELPLATVLATMERTGIRVDTERLKKLGDEFTRRLLAIETQAHALIGTPVNLSSPKQLGELFFEKLGYQVVKKTKTGYSTDQEVLEVLAREHELPRIILEHRMLAKLKSTYVDMLGRMVNPHTGRVHTSFNQTGTATGRLSSSDPNLQNIPVRSDDGRRIRAAFVPEAGHLLMSADYSQIELRIMAHLAQDEHFIDAFRRGEDIHQRTAQEVITAGGPVDPEARRRAKAINFGIIYGLSEFGLSRQLEISRNEAAAYIAAYFGRYPRIRDYQDRSIEDARDRGYVTTITGRRRYLPELSSKNRTVRQGAERIAMNTPIQGSAADLIKLAMLRVMRELAARGLSARLLLQVHDELVLEVPVAEKEATEAAVREAMTTVLSLAVPLEVDIGFGTDWTEAH